MKTDSFRLAQIIRIALPAASIGLAVSFVLLTWLRSLHICLWADEVFTWYPVTDPSFTHLWAVCHLPMNTAPPIYFLIVWLYVHLFGASEFSLRLFSTLCVIGAGWVLWRALKRPCGTVAATIGAVFSCSTGIVIEQSHEARFYGLYYLLSAVFLANVLNRRLQRRPLQWSVTLGITGALFALTHSFGLVFSGAVVVTLLLCYLWHTYRPNVWQRPRTLVAGILGIVASWVLFGAVWGRATWQQQTAFHGLSWIPIPRFQDVRQILHPGKGLMLYVVALMVSAVLLYVRRTNARRRFDRLFYDRAFLVLLGIAYLIIPVIVTYLVSHISASCFLFRYLMPMWQGGGILVAVVVSCCLRDFCPIRINRYVLSLIYCAAIFLLVGYPIARSMLRWQYLTQPPTQQQNIKILHRYLAKNHIKDTIPLCFVNGHLFTVYYHYDKHAPGRYYFIRDSDYFQARPDRGSLMTMDTNIAAWQRSYIPDGVETLMQLRKKHDHFVVIENADAVSGSPVPLNWVESRIIPLPEYRVTALPELTLPNCITDDMPPQHMKVYRIERR